MESAIQLFAAINLLAIGVSHVTAHRAWAELFLLLRAKGEAGVFVVGFMSLVFGSIVAAFHNVWSGIPVVLTVLGWAQVVKAMLYFAYPAHGLRMLQLVSVERSHRFIVPGVLFILLAGLLIYHLVVS